MSKVILYLFDASRSVLRLLNGRKLPLASIRGTHFSIMVKNGMPWWYTRQLMPF